MRIARLVAIALATVLSLASFARGQGTSGQVPEPISTADLHRLMNRYVRPTTTQWDAIESLHDDYREAFRQLRESDIEKFLVDMRQMQGNGMPTRASLEEFMRKYERITHRIEEIDGTLMDGVGAIVGEEKRAAVARVRDARTRTREMTGGIAAGFGGGSVDLSEIAIDSVESEEARALIDPALVSYEQRLTALSRSVGDDSRRMMLDLFKELEKQGFGEMTQEQMTSDPERMKQMMESMQAAWKKVGAKVQKGAAEMRDLNAKTFRSIVGQLEGDSARRLRLRYVGKVHSEIAWSGVQPERLFRAALRISKLDPDVRTRIKADYDSWARADDALLDEGMKLNDEFAKNRSPMDFDATSWQQHSEQVQALRTKRDELGTKSIDALRSTLGDERFNRMEAHALGAAKPDVFDDSGDPEGADPNAGVSASASPMEEGQLEVNVARLSPVSIGMLQSLATAMALDATAKATLETLHSDYLKRWDDEIKPAQAEMTSAEQSIWVQGEEGKPARMDAAKQATFYDRQRAVAERASSLDDELFDDATKALGDDHTARLRVARLDRAVDRFVRANAWGGWSGMFGGEQEQAVNIARLATQASLPEAARVKAVEALALRSDDIVKAYRESFFQSLDVERQIQEQSAKWQEKWASGEQDSSAQMTFGLEMNRMQQRLRELSDSRSKVVSESFTSVLDAVGDEHRAALQFEYDKSAFPGIFNDPRSALPMLDKAAAMDDLTADQKTQVKALRDAYEKEYLDACRKMIPKRATHDSGAKPEEFMLEAMHANDARAKVQFDRDERSARAVSQLRRILNDEQKKRVPSLEDYEKAPSESSGVPVLIE